MASQSPLVALLARELAKFPSLDPRAVLAIAAHEGLSGGVGDHGTSFGPFQLHEGGALPASVPLEHGNQWAWSPAGLDYALSRIQGVAGGLHGRAAIENISRRFERPSDPAAEIADALRHYGPPAQGGPGIGSAPFRPQNGPVTAPGHGSSLLANLIGSTNQLVGLDSPPGLGGQLAAAWGTPGGQRPPENPPASPTSPPARPARFGAGGGIAELLQEGVGGPTHSTGPHIHAAFTDPNVELAAIAWAQAHGLRVAENPYVGSVAPVHAPNSYHTRDFPGLYHGRRLGEAIDVTGPNMRAFYDRLSALRA